MLPIACVRVYGPPPPAVPALAAVCQYRKSCTTVGCACGILGGARAHFTAPGTWGASSSGRAELEPGDEYIF